MAKRRQRKVGYIVQIPMEDGSYCFGRVLEEPLFAFYDLKNDEVPALDDILSSPILFKLWVMNYAVTQGIWPVIGHAPLEEHLQEEVIHFRQDILNGEVFKYYPGGYEEPASVEEVAGLECAAVWDPEHVADRLRDHYLGVPCIWLQDGGEVQPERVPPGWPNSKKNNIKLN